MTCEKLVYFLLSRAQMWWKLHNLTQWGLTFYKNLFTLDLSLMYCNIFSGSFVSNLLSLRGFSHLRSNSLLALLMSSRWNSASFSEAWADTPKSWTTTTTTKKLHVCRCILQRCLSYPVAVPDPFIFLSELLLFLSCLYDFTLCHIFFLF